MSWVNYKGDRKMGCFPSGELGMIKGFNIAPA